MTVFSCHQDSFLVCDYSSGRMIPKITGLLLQPEIVEWNMQYKDNYHNNALNIKAYDIADA